jgi:dolichol-phosphate mannosyltransferase
LVINCMAVHKKYVVIPTYKESRNLIRLLPLLKKYRVIIVDDCSQDGTRELCGKFKNVILIVRKDKRGMASASLDGFMAIRDAHADVVFMDADFEHDPSRLPDLFKGLEKSDFVVGVKTGNRGALRRAISSIGKKVAYAMLPETKLLNDPMSCFFGVRKSSLDRDKLKTIKVEPYGKLMLVLLDVMKKGSKVSQIRYAYGSRSVGESKLSKSYFWDYLKEISRLNRNRFLLFLSIGALGIPFNEGLSTLFYGRMPLPIDFLFAIVISTSVNFLANNYITFKSRSKLLPAFVKFMALSFVITAVTNLVVAIALSYFLFYLLANLFGIIVAFMVKYGISETYIWKSETKAYSISSGNKYA